MKKTSLIPSVNLTFFHKCFLITFYHQCFFYNFFCSGRRDEELKFLLLPTWDGQGNNPHDVPIFNNLLRGTIQIETEKRPSEFNFRPGIQLKVFM